MKPTYKKNMEKNLKYCLGINQNFYHQTMVQSMQLVFQKNDPKHPFEGSYFNPEEPNSEIEIIYDGYGQRLLAKQMESMIEEAISQAAENYYIQGDIIIPEEWQDIPVEEISQWKNYVDLCNQSNSDYKTLGSAWVYIDASTMKGKN
mgnify:CR=1 FL=1